MFAPVFSPDLVADADAIVIGSGLAAIPIATVLADANRRVVMIEGGDMKETPQAAALTETYDSGLFYDGYWARHWVRSLGGTSSRWSGWLVPLDARDLRGNTAGIDWPIAIDSLTPFYERAAPLLDRQPLIARYREPLLDTPFVYKPFSRGRPVRVAERFGERLSVDPNIRILTQHTVTKLAADTGRRSISTIHMTDFSSVRRQLAVRPGQDVILACGGLGNAQVLLQPADGSATPVGNESGLAGRFLMEHPHARCAEALIAADVLPTPPSEFGEFTDALMLDDAQYQRYQLLGCTLSVDRVAVPVEDETHRAFEERFARSLQACTLYARSEQEPDPANGARLLNETDWAGSYKLEVHNALSARDLRSVETTVRLLGAALVERRLGTVRIDNEALYRNATGGGHTMGTTRMGASRRNSVCDRNLRVHGYENLYLAGSSVFPTGGAANPTLTIVALSLRLAEHLMRERRR